MLEAVIRERLGDIPALDALVSGRIYALVLPQNEKRASVRFHVQGALREQHLRGPGAFTMTPVQVDSYVPLSTTDALDTCLEIAAAVRGDGLGENASGLWGWIGMGAGDPGSIDVVQVEALNDGETTYESDEILRVRVRQLFRVHWRLTPSFLLNDVILSSSSSLVSSGDILASGAET